MNNHENQVENSKFEMILHSAMEFPGVKIERSSFLRKELSKFYDTHIVNNAIATNPAQAGIKSEELDRIAKACISSETIKVSAISAAAGIPGGFAMAATIPADAAQFFAHIIRIMQKLVYLYGWQDMFNDEGGLDDETSNQLTLFIGAMAGVNAANMALSKIALMAAENVPKQLVRRALTQGMIYPIVKTTAKAIGIKMTKPIFAKGIGKLIPIVGAVASGGITYAIFKPMANRLKKYLETLPLASVGFYKDSQVNSGILEVSDLPVV